MKAHMIWRAKYYETRFRIGRLTHYIPPEKPDPTAIGDGTPGWNDESVFVEDVREYNNRGRTAYGSDTPYARYKKKITNNGGTAIEQVGILLWMNAEEATVMLKELNEKGWWPQQ